MRRISFAAALLIALLCVSALAESVTTIPLGGGLPDWTPDGAYTAAELPEHADKQGLVGVYTSDAGFSDVYVYSCSKDESISLKEFGQRLAAERNVFCNMMTDGDIPAAVLNYHDCADGVHAVVQAYIFEADAAFVEVCTRFETEAVPLGGEDVSIHMLREYDAQAQGETPLLFDTVYRSENERLPQLHIRRFCREDFPVEAIEPELLDAVSEKRVAELAEDGWTLEEFVALYDEGYELLKGEVTCRNDFDHAFIGYIDDGIFCTRAFVDDGEDYVLICAEAEASKFQHITNAMIDALEKN